MTVRSVLGRLEFACRCVATRAEAQVTLYILTRGHLRVAVNGSRHLEGAHGVPRRYGLRKLTPSKAHAYRPSDNR